MTKIRKSSPKRFLDQEALGLKQSEEKWSEKKLLACAAACLPERVKQVKILQGQNLSGFSFIKARVIYTPPINTRARLQVFLHECAHHALHHASTGARYIEEYEAEKWSYARMREWGIPLPRASQRWGKHYVGYMVQIAIARGAKHIRPDIKAFAAPIELYRYQRVRGTIRIGVTDEFYDILSGIDDEKETRLLSGTIGSALPA